jgi:hypothetical protein
MDTFIIIELYEYIGVFCAQSIQKELDYTKGIIRSRQTEEGQKIKSLN